ncbi:hypothetical protein GCM10027346_05290 [Hymenobacter seoulensis]
MNTLPDSLIPPDDQERLQSLHYYQITNTTPERIFNEYVELAAQVFNLPISLISLIDEHKVFFKANLGLPGLEQLPRTDSLCSAAILQNQVLSYKDLNENSCRLINPDTAQEAGLRFYAGAPLHMPDGSNIGTMCIIGREPREITPGEEKLLMALAELVSLTISLRQYFLSSNRESDWLVTQAEIQELLHDQAAMVRYLTARLGTLTYNAAELEAAQNRLTPLRNLLTKRLAEFAGVLTE